MDGSILPPLGIPAGAAEGPEAAGRPAGRSSGELAAVPSGGDSAGLAAASSATRRSGPDRRKRPTPRLSRYSLMGGRRQTVRRKEEREGSFVDRYGWSVVLSVILIASLNVADSFFTLLHLQAGGIELNPVAEALLRTGRVSFVTWKSVIIDLALVILVLHKNFVLARLGLWVAAGAYGLLVAWHLYLLTL